MDRELHYAELCALLPWIKTLTIGKIDFDKSGAIGLVQTVRCILLLLHFLQTKYTVYTSSSPKCFQLELNQFCSLAIGDEIDEHHMIVSPASSQQVSILAMWYVL